MQDIFDLRAAPAVNRLVVVAYDKQISVLGSKQFYDFELHGVGILKFVDMDVTESARKKFACFFLVCE